MKKYKRIITAYGLVWCMLFSLSSPTLNRKKEDHDHEHSYKEYSEYMVSDVTYKDLDNDKEIFVTFEEIVNYKWYILETSENVIISKRASFDNLPNGKHCYYYKNALDNENKVYRVIYNTNEENITVESGPKIISTYFLADFLIDYNLGKLYYTKEEINEVLALATEKLPEIKELNTGNVFIK